jgi:hypothetical protein
MSSRQRDSFQTVRLWAVSPQNSNLIWKDSTNKEILVAAWINSDIYSRIVKSGGTPQLTKTEEGTQRTLILDTWITLVPQVREFCRNFIITSGNSSALLLNKRLQQYLGLPGFSMTHFVEMWVNTTTVFRPCLDPRIDSEYCELAPTFIADPAHEKWMKNVKELANRSNLPFTGLGYTYDLGSETHIGASEYVIRSGTEVTIAAVMTTEEYSA